MIYALTGTDDTAYPALNRQIEAMKNYPESFTYSDRVGDGNLFFQVAEGGVHNYTSMIQYIYNALPVFDRMMGADEKTMSLVVENRLPVYLAIGESDEYYSSEPTREAYDALRELYLEQELSEAEIDKLQRPAWRRRTVCL